MPRIKTKGEAICFRLPVHLYDVLVELANEADVTPQQWALDRLTIVLDGIALSPTVATKVGGADSQSAARRMLDGIT